MAGRKIPENELIYLVQQSKLSSLPDNSLMRKLTRSMAFGRRKKTPILQGSDQDSFRFNSMVPNEKYTQKIKLLNKNKSTQGTNS